MNLRFELPTPRADAVLAFASDKACGDWLRALPHSNPTAVQAQLRAQMALLPIAGLKPAVLFELAECLREPVVRVQSEMARKFSFRPLPLADAEAGVLEASLDLWRGLGVVYRVCVQSILDQERELRQQSATVCQRALDAHARLILDIQCGGNEVPEPDWRLLHRLYRAAETSGVAADKVKDALLEGVGATHCMATYARPVLLSLGLPGEVAQRHLLSVAFWTERLANRVTITSLPPAQPSKPPVLVDLDAGRGGFRPEDGAEIGSSQALRYLDISDLAVAMKKRIHLLRKGETSASLGLGEEGALPTIEQTLILLYKHWGDGRVGREHPRRSVSGKALAVLGISGLHFYVSGKAFKQPGAAPELTTRQIRAITAFGRGSTHDQDDSGMQGYSLDEWRILDESMIGLCLQRTTGTAGSRLSPGSLIGVKPSDARAFIVGSVRWVQMQAGGKLIAGVRTLPGAPQAVAVRPDGGAEAGEKYHPGLMLPAVPALRAPSSVVVPAGWFRAGRILDVHAESAWQIRLETIVDHIGDHDICAYASLAA